jgi:hypothetical protein
MDSLVVHVPLLGYVVLQVGNSKVTAVLGRSKIDLHVDTGAVSDCAIREL